MSKWFGKYENYLILCLLGLLLAACSVCRKSLKVWDPLCCSSIFWLKVWDGAQPDERVWTLATAGRAGGDRPATAPRIACPSPKVPNPRYAPPANSTGPPRVHGSTPRWGGKTERATAAAAVRGSEPPRAYRLRFGQVGWAPTAPRAAGSRAPVRTATSRVACHAPLLWLEPGGRRWTVPVPRWGLCDADACGSPFLRLGFIQHWWYIYTWPMGAWHVVDYQRLCWLIDCLAGVGKLSVINTIISSCSWLRWCLICQNVT